MRKFTRVMGPFEQQRFARIDRNGQGYVRLPDDNRDCLMVGKEVYSYTKKDCAITDESSR